MAEIGVRWTRVDDLEPEVRSRLASHLSSRESARAQRFRFRRDRERFVASHGFLREILADLTDTDPGELTFGENEAGKPHLILPRRSAPHFNLSHAESLTTVAISSECQVGVDIERISAFEDMKELVRRHFAPSEREALRALEGSDRVDAFFRCWTRKEAVLKARGTGLGDSLSDFAVTVEPTESARLVSGNSRLGDPVEWSLVHFEPSSGYVGAVAAPVKQCSVTVREWP